VIALRQKKIMAVLLAVLTLAVCILAGNLILLYRNMYRIPEQAVLDLCHILKREGIRLDPELVPRIREDGILYVSDGTGYEENAAFLLAGSEIKSTYVIPDGQLFLHYNGDITEFTDGFGFHYRRASLETEGRIVDASGAAAAFDTLAAELPVLSETGTAAQAAAAFLEQQEDKLRRDVQIDTVIAAVRGDDNGRAYVQCLRKVDGVEITENAVICLVENGVVTEAAGKWCFMTVGESYKAQLSDITNILFMMKRTMAEHMETETCTIVGLERCYSLYFLSQDEGFCLIPCWRVELDTGDVLVYSALDGTLYTKMGEIT